MTDDIVKKATVFIARDEGSKEIVAGYFGEAKEVCEIIGLTMISNEIIRNAVLEAAQIYRSLENKLGKTNLEQQGNEALTFVGDTQEELEAYFEEQEKKSKMN